MDTCIVFLSYQTVNESCVVFMCVEGSRRSVFAVEIDHLLQNGLNYIVERPMILNIRIIY